MTATRLQTIVRMLSNSHWCRYWLNWNVCDWRTMAISCMEARDGRHGIEWVPVLVPELLKRGFRQEQRDGMTYYLIERTNEDGSPFAGDLP